LVILLDMHILTIPITHLILIILIILITLPTPKTVNRKMTWLYHPITSSNPIWRTGRLRSRRQPVNKDRSSCNITSIRVTTIIATTSPIQTRYGFRHIGSRPATDGFGSKDTGKKPIDPDRLQIICQAFDVLFIKGHFCFGPDSWPGLGSVKIFQ